MGTTGTVITAIVLAVAIALAVIKICMNRSIRKSMNVSTAETDTVTVSCDVIGESEDNKEDSKN